MSNPYANTDATSDFDTTGNDDLVLDNKAIDYATRDTSSNVAQGASSQEAPDAPGSGATGANMGGGGTYRDANTAAEGLGGTASGTASLTATDTADQADDFNAEIVREYEAERRGG